jgi:shikimate dehydrogenase
VTRPPGRVVLLGHPVGHSLSPAIQNAALRAAGIDLTYVPLDVPRSALERTLEELRATRTPGNVTMPYKQDVHAACDRLTPTARKVGAVNTFWVAVDGAMVGANTDVDGFRAAVATLIGPPPTDATVAILGAGGCAAAVLHEMEGWPRVSVRLYSRTRARGEALVRRFSLEATVCASAEDAVRGATLVVNATPIGLKGDAIPVDVEALSPDAAVFDLAYAPGETALVRAARARAHRACDGMTMLVEQAAAAFEHWFGQQPDRGSMWAAIRTSG